MPSMNVERKKEERERGQGGTAQVNKRAHEV